MVKRKIDAINDWLKELKLEAKTVLKFANNNYAFIRGGKDSKTPWIVVDEDGNEFILGCL